MSPDALQVTATHLRGLAATQVRAAVELGSATDLVSDVDRLIASSHGATATAGGARALSEGLTAAARRYEHTDDYAGRDLDRQVRPR